MKERSGVQRDAGVDVVLVVGPIGSAVGGFAKLLEAAGVDVLAARPLEEEPSAIGSVSDSLLVSLGQRWDAPTASPLGSALPDSAIDEITTITRGASDSGVMPFVADSRTSLLLPQWRAALDDRLEAILLVQSRVSAARAVEATYGITEDTALAVVAAYYRHAYLGLAGLGVALVPYDTRSDVDGAGLATLASGRGWISDEQARAMAAAAATPTTDKDVEVRWLPHFDLDATSPTPSESEALSRRAIESRRESDERIHQTALLATATASRLRWMPPVPQDGGEGRQPDDRGLWRTGQEAFERHAYGSALASWLSYTRQQDATAADWTWVARAWLKLGDRDASYAAIECALEQGPSEALPSWHLASLLEGDARDEECRELVSRLCSAHPDDTVIAGRSIEVLCRLGAWDDVRHLATRLRVRHPHHPAALAGEASWLEHQRTLAVGQRYIEASSQEDPVTRGLAMATYHTWADRPFDAWLALRDLPPGDVGTDTLFKAGLGLRHAGYLESARDAFAAASSVDPGHRRSRYWAEVMDGEVVLASGRWQPPAPRREPLPRRPGRILHVVGRSLPYAHTGYSVRTEYIVDAQKAGGLDPHVVTQLGFPPQSVGVLEPDIETVPHHRLRPPDGRVPRRPDEALSQNLDELKSLVERLEPAVLHAASDYRNAMLALQVREAFAIPVVYEVRGFWEDSWSVPSGRDTRAEVYGWRRDRETECMMAADGVVTLSQSMADEISSRGVPRSSITIVPNGVDIDKFTPVARDAMLAHRYGIRPDEVTLGYISSFSSYEGIRFLIEATAVLRGQGLAVRTLLVGDGPDLPALRRQTAELGLGDAVIFCGRVPHAEVLVYYGMIDIFVVPRTTDRVSRLVTPLKPLEAMATERAVLVSRTEALASMVEEGVTGEVFEPEDPVDLARVAAGLVLDQDRRRTLGRAARAWVASDRTWSSVVAGYDGVYADLSPSLAEVR